jgi:hypothetical protein
MSSPGAVLFAVFAAVDLLAMVQLRRRRMLQRWSDRCAHNLRLANRFLGS